MPEGYTATHLVVLGILVACSAFFSGSETALLGADWWRMRYLARKGDPRARIYEALVQRRDLLIGTILVGNNLANIAASSLATAVAIGWFGEQGIAVATGVMTVLLLVVSEIAPKTFASQKAETVSLIVAPVFAVLCRVLFPVVGAVTHLSNGLLRLFGARPEAGARPGLSEEEIRVLLSDREGAAMDESRRRMLRGIFRIAGQQVREVMVPRVRVRALDVAIPLRQAVETFVETGYTRMPVYRENLDDLIGIVHVRDAVALLLRDPEGSLAAVAREPFFVPETKDLESLLYEFRTRRTHMAVVVDEYGGVEGIVTLEDVIEEIVGEIRDEHDVEAEPVRLLPGGEALVHGGTPIREINEKLGLNLPAEPDVTLGGFMMTRLGHIPWPGESVEYGGHRLTVERVSGRRVLLVRITRAESQGGSRGPTPETAP